LKVAKRWRVTLLKAGDVSAYVDGHSQQRLSGRLVVDGVRKALAHGRAGFHVANNGIFHAASPPAGKLNEDPLCMCLKAGKL
jgi:hypothetical protein